MSGGFLNIDKRYPQSGYNGWDASGRHWVITRHGNLFTAKEIDGGRFFSRKSLGNVSKILMVVTDRTSQEAIKTYHWD